MHRTKRSWPLFVLAGSSFLPGLGLLLGAVAVTWGLISDRPRAMLAAGVGAAGALLNLLGGVLLVWHVERGPTYAAVGERSARRDLARLVGALEAYRDQRGHYPARLAAFTELPYSLQLVNIQDFSAGIFARPREYQYELAPDGQTYMLAAVGIDGEPGTSDDVYPDLPDSVAQHSGYRAPR